MENFVRQGQEEEKHDEQASPKVHIIMIDCKTLDRYTGLTDVLAQTDQWSVPLGGPYR